MSTATVAAAAATAAAAASTAEAAGSAWGARHRVVLADHQATLRAGVRAVLEADGFVVVAEAGDADAAVAACLDLGPDLCLIDVHLPGNGIATCRLVRDLCPAVIPVMFSEQVDDDELLDALRVGAAGYLLKSTSLPGIGSALRGVLAGEVALSRSMVSRLIARMQARRERCLELGRRGAQLSDREWEVVELLADGLATDEIGRRLFLSAITVRSHLRAVIKKLALPDRQALLDLLRAGA